MIIDYIKDVFIDVYCFWRNKKKKACTYAYDYIILYMILQKDASIRRNCPGVQNEPVGTCHQGVLCKLHAVAVQISQGFALARGLRGRDRISQGTHWAIDPWTGCSCHTFSWQNDTDGKLAKRSMFS